MDGWKNKLAGGQGQKPAWLPCRREAHRQQAHARVEPVTRALN